MRITKKMHCDKCNKDVNVNVASTPTSDKVDCICAVCGNPITLTVDDIMPEWRKVLFGNTSKTIKEN